MPSLDKYLEIYFISKPDREHVGVQYVTNREIISYLLRVIKTKEFTYPKKSEVLLAILLGSLKGN